MDQKGEFQSFLGGIFGGFIGDAIGLLCNGSSLERLSKGLTIIRDKKCIKYGTGFNRKYIGPINGNFKYLYKKFYPFGQYTEKSQLVREMMEIFLHKNYIDNDIFYKRLIELHKNKKIIVPDKITFSHDAVSRCDIFGLLYQNKTKKIIKMCKKHVQLAEQSISNVAAGVAFGLMISFVYQNKIFDSDDLIYYIYKHIYKIDRNFSSQFFLLSNLIDTDDFLAYKMISKWGDSSTIWAFYSFIKHRHNFFKCIHTACKNGGDTIKMCKIVGSLFGTYNNISKIPKTFIQSLNDNNQWYSNDLKILATKVYEKNKHNEFLINTANFNALYC
jgi:ADP-ribosylglycohydrolase